MAASEVVGSHYVRKCSESVYECHLVTFVNHFGMTTLSFPPLREGVVPAPRVDSAPRAARAARQGC